MRKSTIVVVVAFMVLLLSSQASAVRYSVGGFGGLVFPLGMEDVSSSSMFGFKARVALLPSVGVEPNFTINKLGKGEAEVYDEIQERDGGDITSFGIDLVVGGIEGNLGLSVYGIAGIGSAKWSRDGSDDVTKMSYFLGMGLEYGFSPMVSLDVRGKTLIMPNEDGTYKTLGISAGLNFYFGVGGGL